MGFITWGDHREADLNTRKTIAPPLYIDCLRAFGTGEGFTKMLVTIYADQYQNIFI